MTPAAPPSPESRAMTWLALGVVALPVLQLLSWDFDFSAPLAICPPALWFGRAALARATARLGTAAAGWRVLAGAILLVAVLGAALSRHSAASFVALSSWTLLGGSALLAGQLIAEDPTRARRLLGALALAGALGTTLHWVRWKLGSSPDDALYLHSRLMGLHLLGSSLAATALLATARRWSVPWIVIGAVAWGGLLWTGSRSPLVGLAAGLGLWMWRTAPPGRRRLALACGLHVVAGLALSAALAADRPYLGWLRVAQSATTVPTSAQALTSNRTEFWRGALAQMPAAPWLGHGPDAYRFLEPKLEGAQPHNVILQVVLDFGAPASLGLAAWAGLALLRGFRRMGADEARAGFMALALASLIAGQLDGYFYHLLGLSAATLGLGVCLTATTAPPAPAASPCLRATLVPLVLATGATLVLLLHTWLVQRVALAPPPPPGGAVARAWQAFPSMTQHLERWISAWERTSPAAALELARFARDRTPFGDFFHVQIAGLLLRAGDRAGAQRELAAARAIAPVPMRPVIEDLQRRIASPNP
jgi:O-antigen ligase